MRIEAYCFAFESEIFMGRRQLNAALCRISCQFCRQTRKMSFELTGGVANGGSWQAKSNDRFWPAVLSGVRATLRPLKNLWFRRTSASWRRALLTLSSISRPSDCPHSRHPYDRCALELAGAPIRIVWPMPPLQVSSGDGCSLADKGRQIEVAWCESNPISHSFS